MPAALYRWGVVGAKIHYLGDGNPGPRGGKVYEFYCVGCGYSHPFEVDCVEKGWTWNGSLDKPTFMPSLMVNGSIPEKRCHSVVTDGRIQYLADCHHCLAGQMVELTDWDSATSTDWS